MLIESGTYLCLQPAWPLSRNIIWGKSFLFSTSHFFICKTDWMTGRQLDILSPNIKKKNRWKYNQHSNLGKYYLEYLRMQNYKSNGKKGGSIKSFSDWILWGLFVPLSKKNALVWHVGWGGKSIQEMKLDKFRCFVIVATEHVLYWQNMLSDIGIPSKSI